MTFPTSAQRLRDMQLATAAPAFDCKSPEFPAHEQNVTSQLCLAVHPTFNSELA
jgi:hypothetical protein